MNSSKTSLLAVALAVLTMLLSGPANAAAGHSAKSGVESTKFSGIVRHCFKHWDSNHDGGISAAEIDAAVCDHSLSSDESAALAVLKLSEGRAKNSVVFTRGLLSAYEHAVAGQAQQDNSYDKQFRACRQQLSKARRQLLFAVIMHVNSAHHGNVGECPIFSLATTFQGQSAEKLSKMVTRVGGSNYKISAPGRPSVTLYIPSKTELALNPQSGSRGYWEQQIVTACADLKPTSHEGGSPIESLISALSTFELIPQLGSHD